MVVDLVIEASGLAQRYWRHWVFRSLDLKVKPGVTALLGPNGAGKTTLLHTIVGLRPPVSGTLSVLGIDVLSRGGLRAVARDIGFLPQNVGFYPRYTVREYVAYAAWLKGVRSSQLDGLVRSALDDVKMVPHATKRMAALSGGMLRRAGIAQALVARPRLLLLDEPVAGLDPEQRIELRRVIRSLSEASSVLISTHEVEDARHIADRLLVLRDGDITFDGTVSDLAGAAIGSEGDTDLERGYLSVIRRNVAP
jgi:ABC-2 type transport system ATP-binding protein